MKSLNVNYYDLNVEKYASSSEKLDMEFMRDKFLSYGVKNTILDAGCGSGRDSKAFIEKNINVVSFDASEKMIERLKKESNHEIYVSDFENLSERKRFDGIWCCAALLHIRPESFSQSFNNLANALMPNGVFYFSIKKLENNYYNDGEREFFHPGYELLKNLFRENSLELLESFETGKIGDLTQTFENYFLRKTN